MPSYLLRADKTRSNAVVTGLGPESQHSFTAGQGRSPAAALLSANPNLAR